jgi:hypothetical protein
MNLRNFLVKILTISLLTSCGTVQTERGESQTAFLYGKTYQRVLVKNFTHTVADDDGTTPFAALKFADEIANAIRIAKPTADVSRTGNPAEGTLVISGEVTRYVEGSAALRFLVGMGAGSSYFDANVYITDGATGQRLSIIRVDKNSWGLGGGIAATQTVGNFMKQGAKKTASEVVTFLR